MGGSIDLVDDHADYKKLISNAAARETEEESNGVFTKEFLINKLNYKKGFHAKSFKMYVFYLKIEKNDYNNMNAFGLEETNNPGI